MDAGHSDAVLWSLEPSQVHTLSVTWAVRLSKLQLLHTPDTGDGRDLWYRGTWGLHLPLAGSRL